MFLERTERLALVDFDNKHINYIDLINNINRVSLIYLVLGGVLYSLGTIFYSWKICKFNHMIWHIFVIMGSISHFFAVYYLV